MSVSNCDAASDKTSLSTEGILCILYVKSGLIKKSVILRISGIHTAHLK